ncbi:Aldehyde/histidinol dehydrogenase [Lipomyces oligophaga]|uniref:Aldehyde/histidinol dehydrogenase n=1 Tax=Lipomyces oligophaga TaxID=45792 RepID=UPI0034CF0B63
MAGLGIFSTPTTENEPVHSYEPGSKDRQQLAAAIKSLQAQLPLRIPLVIDGQPIYTEAVSKHLDPSNFTRVLAETSQASIEHVAKAIVAAQKAKRTWESSSLDTRSAIFLKAADLIANKYRFELLAATIIGQGKNIYQAEIDAAAELIDFLRFNALYAHELYKQQPLKSSPGIWNRAEYCALDGFVYAVTPFNFTAIAGNIVAAPALMGNTIVWKPSPYAVLSNYLLLNIFIEAGIPAGVINFVPGDAVTVTKEVLSSRTFGGLHFTGSSEVFRNLYAQIAGNLAHYRSYPRIVGETGGKNFHLIHKSASIASAAKSSIRGAFEYQGQKCSATSRIYVAESISSSFINHLVAETNKLIMGSPADELTAFIGPVIHHSSFKKLDILLKTLQEDSGVKILAGGKTNGTTGYYVEPTIVLADSADHEVLKTEFFGPILAIYVYPDEEYESIMETIDLSTDYALTGSVYAQDRAAIEVALQKLRHSAGNFYINDKSTGAVVGQQWFGGSRQSGTNDKSGSGNILNRFVSIRSIKETFYDTSEVGYPSNIE